mmetsp:Transcript_31090/g.73010  ORF Transcript_31090/g.73010 Transcript_31090/m.73010 type:complete len:133 (+) Transcript_31090:183-581(+)
MKHLLNIYVERCALLWKPQGQLLLSAARLAMQLVDDGAAAPRHGACLDGAERLALYRHAQIADFSDTVVTLPQDVDPIQGRQHHPQAAAVGVPIDPHANAFLQFLQSMLPWTANPAGEMPPPDGDWDDEPFA